MINRSYQILILFFSLSAIGLILLPRLSLQLLPSPGGSIITVTYNWPGASPEAIERQVSTKLEGLFNRLANVKKIRSVSAYNHGYISIEIDKSANIDAFRFELASLIRQVYPKLPETVDYPKISLNSIHDQSISKPLLTLQLSGSLSNEQLLIFANEQLKPRLATVEGIGGISIFGGSLPEWVLTYDINALKSFHLTEQNVREAIKKFFQRESLGQLISDGKTLRIQLDNTLPNQSNYWSQIPVAKISDRIIYLTDLVSVDRKEPSATSFYRINGKTAVNIVLIAAPGVNQLTVTRKLRHLLTKIFLPEYLLLDIDYDSTIYIRENLRKIGVQTSLAIVILLLFVALTTRKLIYVAIILVSTIVTLLLTLLVFVLFNVDIHLYTLAALTTSLGIIMDNVIVMIDHYRRYRDLRIFTALLGATLATSAGLIFVLFLPEENRIALTDFSIVLAVTLFISLLVAMVFTPVMIEHFENKRKENKYQKQTKLIKHILWWEKQYTNSIKFLLYYRWAPILIAILFLGIPFFWLPVSLEKENPLAPYYASTLGSKWYINNLQPYINKWLGGTLRLFVNYVDEGAYTNEPERTALYIIAELPNHSTPEQMNAIFRQFELNLSKYKEIDKFISQIDNGQEGSMVVYFKDPFDKGLFPYQLKDKVILLATEMSGIDWNIFGIGQGFSQRLSVDESPVFNLEMYGYNYRQLEHEVNALKNILEKNSRIQKVNINRTTGLFQRKSLDEFIFQTNPQLLAFNQLNDQQLFDRLVDFNVRSKPDQYAFINGTYEPIKIIPSQSQTTDIWQLQNQPISVGSNSVYLRDIGEIVRQKVTPEILREDQQYIRFISFNYFGSFSFGEKFLIKTLTKLRSQLPLGYTIKEINRFQYTSNEGYNFKLFFLIILLIYIICTVIFENLFQPLALIALIPLSYTGVFVAFYLTESDLDKGGYAAFILLTGNVVCAGIYLVAEMNRLHKRYPNINSFVAYQKAFRHKVITIFLTVLSTVVGMLPFLIYEHEAFWYSLSVGTIGGLLMSLVAIVIYLPLFLLKK